MNQQKYSCWPVALFIALAALALTAPQAAWACGGGIICVDKDAAGANNGASWANAYTTLQAALDHTNAHGGATYEIWVAEGVYYPDEGGSHLNNIMTETFRIAYNNVQLYGGFAATETSREQRNWTAHPTILSGDIDSNDWNTDTNAIAETWNDVLGNNAYHVLYLDGATNQSITGATMWDGFTITAGKAAGAGQHSGGGIYCAGGVAGRTCNPQLTNIIISGNLAEANGGGMYNNGRNDGESNPRLNHVTISGNSAEYGGGMYNDGESHALSSPALTYVTFSGNSARYGGGMFNSAYNGESSPSLINVTFSDNVANSGGGMYNDGESNGVNRPWLSNVVFSGNSASFGGGGMYNNAEGGMSRPTLTNGIFSGNHADYGAGIYDDGNGGDCSPTLTNVTFSGNAAAELGGGMYNVGGDTSQPILVNCILWGNTAANGLQIYSIYGVTPIVTYSDVQWPSGVYTGTGNLNVDPQFVAPIAAAATPTTLGNYRLRATSPVIDAGDNSSAAGATDLDGSPRKVDMPIADTGAGAAPIVDMGAYEAHTPGVQHLYLSAILRAWPPLPGTPILQTIANSDGDGAYTVQWTTANLATSYELQEDNNAAFSGATTIYNGAATSWNALGKSNGTYYYRVRGQSAHGPGPWSPAQSVWVSPPNVFSATEDAYIAGGYPDNNYGAAPIMRAGYDGGDAPPAEIVRGLVKFNLAAIPANTQISAAVLQVYYSSYWGPNNYARTVTAHGVNSAWSEGSVTWNTAPAPGNAYGSISLTSSDPQGYYSIDVTDLVRGWINSAAPNHGIMLRGPENPGGDASSRSFAAKEGGTSFTPKLQITYSGMTTQITLNPVRPEVLDAARQDRPAGAIPQ